LLFSGHVRQRQSLTAGLVFVLRIVVVQGALDIQRKGVLPSILFE
jgi:hypothetical protein